MSVSLLNPRGVFRNLHVTWVLVLQTLTRVGVEVP